MYLMDYDSVKVTNYVQRFCIIPRVRNGVAEFTLLVQLVNNERTEVYDDTYEDPRDNLKRFFDKLIKAKVFDVDTMVFKSNGTNVLYVYKGGILFDDESGNVRAWQRDTSSGKAVRIKDETTLLDALESLIVQELE